jgi:O-antigen/teichoic acid export membrane protein
VRQGFGLIGVAVASVSTSLLDSVTRVAVAYSMEPRLSIRRQYYTPSKVRELFNYSSITFVGKVADVMRFKLDHLVITAYVGLAAVTHYAIAMRLVEYLSGLMAQGLSGVGPFFSQDEGRNDFANIRKNILFLVKMSVYVALFLGGMTLMYGRHFILRWMGPEFADSYKYLVILLVPFLTLLVQTPTGALLYGISQHKFLTVCNIIEGSTNVILSLIWVKHYGIAGVAMGTAVPMLVMGLAARPWYLCRAIGLPLWDYLKPMIQNSLFAIALLLGGWLIGRMIAAPDYGRIVVCVILQAVIYWPAAIFIGLSQADRDKILSAAKKAFFKSGLPLKTVGETPGGVV